MASGDVGLVRCSRLLHPRPPQGVAAGASAAALTEPVSKVRPPTSVAAVGASSSAAARRARAGLGPLRPSPAATGPLGAAKVASLTAYLIHIPAVSMSGGVAGEAGTTRGRQRQRSPLHPDTYRPRGADALLQPRPGNTAGISGTGPQPNDSPARSSHSFQLGKPGPQPLPDVEGGKGSRGCHMPAKERILNIPRYTSLTYFLGGRFYRECFTFIVGTWGLNKEFGTACQETSAGMINLTQTSYIKFAYNL